MLQFFWPFVLLAAALFEVGGDAASQKGLQGKGLGYSIVGFLMLGLYGIGVNLLGWNLSKLLGCYVAFFAVVSLWWGWYFNAETISRPTLLGLALIVIGGGVISWAEITTLVQQWAAAARNVFG